jgi:hypothetical protein
LNYLIGDHYFTFNYMDFSQGCLKKKKEIDRRIIDKQTTRGRGSRRGEWRWRNFARFELVQAPKTARANAPEI